MKTYAELLQEFPPKIIEDDEQLEATQKVINKKQGILSKDELNYKELLILLVEDYQNTNGKLDTFNLNYYLDNEIHTPEEQIGLLYTKLSELRKRGIEFILSTGQDQLIQPLSYEPDLDISFLIEDEDFLNVEFNEFIENTVEEAFDEIVNECKKRNTKTIILFAYAYPKPRFKGYINDVGVEINFD